MLGFIHKWDYNTVTSVLKTLKQLRRAIQNERRGVFHHDNAHPPTAARPRALLEHFTWELFDHPPYIPELAPSDCRLFTYPEIC
jgi:transposase